MKKSALLSLSCSCSVALLLVAGCGTGGTTNPNDAGTGTDLSVPATTNDMTAPPAQDLTAAPAGDMSQPNRGTKLASGAVQVSGITDDDRVVFVDPRNGAEAVPIAGGSAPDVIDGTSDTVAIVHKVVFSWSNTDMVTSLGDLLVYSGAAGVKKLGGASVSGLVASDPGGAWILYTLGGSMDGSNADLTVAKSDGTGVKTVYKQAQTDASCTPLMEWANGKFVIDYCAGAVGDGGVSPALLALLDPATGTATPIAGAYSNNVLSVDKMGKYAVVTTDKDDLVAVPLAGGSNIALDTSVAIAAISDDATLVVYRTKGGALKKVAIPGAGQAAAPVVLVASNANVLQGVSKDFKWALYSSAVDAMTGLGDLFLASVATPGMPVTLTATMTSASGGPYGDSFSADGTRVYYFTDVSATDFVGTLKTRPVAGGNETVLGTTVWKSLATKGTNLVYNDNFKMVPNQNGRGDIQVVNSASGALMPKLITPAADVDIVLSAAKDKVAFSVSAPVTAQGLYALPVP